MKNAVCMHEEDYGTLWKHNEFRVGMHEMRRSRRLVISFFATVGNSMVRAVLWSLEKAIKILLFRTLPALPSPNLPRKGEGQKTPCLSQLG
ncbi:hypothetical protein DERA104750_04340 [Deinococcus radiodurans]|nr:hypothetical protein A2G07_15545 [Deinococcus radiodurans R1 = ATCC 13939 = DSM 20539]